MERGCFVEAGYFARHARLEEVFAERGFFYNTELVLGILRNDARTTATSNVGIYGVQPVIHELRVAEASAGAQNPPPGGI